jgi:hypothetical protein
VPSQIISEPALLAVIKQPMQSIRAINTIRTL